MERTNLYDGLMAEMIEAEAWKDLSSSYPWSEELLDRYKDKVDWESVSSNRNVSWTVSMLEKFKKRINWYELSRYCIKTMLVPEILERFKDRWDWREISENNELPLDSIRKMADYIDWKALIERAYRDDIFGLEFLKEFEDRIPAASFKDSNLWRKLVDDRGEQLRAEIMLG